MGGNGIVKLESVNQFNQERGQTTLHPLVTVLDQSKSSLLSPTKWISSLYIVFIKDSKCSHIKYGRNYYDYQDRTMLFVAPGQVMGIEEDGMYQPNGWVLAFHPDLIHGTSLGKYINDYSFFSYNVNEALHLAERERLVIMDALLKIQSELNQAIDKYSRKLIVNNIELLLNYSMRFYDRQFITREHVLKDILVRFEKLLNEYFQSDKPQLLGIPTVTYCADKLHLSPNYFGDLIKKETGKTALEYIQQKLITLAKEMVLDQSNTISEVAYKIGFKYPQHFTRLFKKYVGQTPQAYRSPN
ncbi:MAG: AraC family transcriptional regulator [Thalassobius sp.]|nr:AraC family transcriptional regulator [Thalassovita sp.]